MVHSIKKDKLIVKLENGIFGELLSSDTEKYTVGEQLRLFIKQVKNVKVILRLGDACQEKDNNVSSI